MYCMYYMYAQNRKFARGMWIFLTKRPFFFTDPQEVWEGVLPQMIVKQAIKQISNCPRGKGPHLVYHPCKAVRIADKHIFSDTLCTIWYYMYYKYHMGMIIYFHHINPHIWWLNPVLYENSVATNHPVVLRMSLAWAMPRRCPAVVKWTRWRTPKDRTVESYYHILIYCISISIIFMMDKKDT